MRRKTVAGRSGCGRGRPVHVRRTGGVLPRRPALGLRLDVRVVDVAARRRVAGQRLLARRRLTVGLTILRPKAVGVDVPVRPDRQVDGTLREAGIRRAVRWRVGVQRKRTIQIGSGSGLRPIIVLAASYSGRRAMMLLSSFD